MVPDGERDEDENKGDVDKSFNLFGIGLRSVIRDLFPNVQKDILNGVIIGTKPNKKNAFQGPHSDSQFIRDFA